MKRMKVTSMILVLLLVIGLFSACGNGEEVANMTSETENNQAGSTDSSDDSNNDQEVVPKEERVVTIYALSSDLEDATIQQLNSDFTKQTGIEVEQIPISGDADEYQTKVKISMLAGEDIDVYKMTNSVVREESVNAGFLMPLNEMFEKYNYDADSKFGKYLSKDSDGTVYTLPYSVSMWAVFYNKKIFDDAGVEYPVGPWTWDEYIETAQKLTDKDKGIYGSYMLDYDNYRYFLAKQQGVSAYKEDGSSNYDDPAFAEAMKFYKDLGNEYGIQPSFLEYKTKNYAWNQFMNGQFGMHFIGSWYLRLLNDEVEYPRDWDYGVVQIPTPVGGGNNFGNTGTYGINKNAANPDEAFEYLVFLAENEASYRNELSPRIDMTDEELTSYFGKIAEESDGSVSVDDLIRAFIDNDLGFISEKIDGVAATEHKSIIVQESELYLFGEQTLEDTIANIKTRADEAIEKANSTN